MISYWLYPYWKVNVFICSLYLNELVTSELIQTKHPNQGFSPTFELSQKACICPYFLAFSKPWLLAPTWYRISSSGSLTFSFQKTHKKCLKIQGCFFFKYLCISRRTHCYTYIYKKIYHCNLKKESCFKIKWFFIKWEILKLDFRKISIEHAEKSLDFYFLMKRIGFSHTVLETYTVETVWNRF